MYIYKKATLVFDRIMQTIAEIVHFHLVNCSVNINPSNFPEFRPEIRGNHV